MNRHQNLIHVERLNQGEPIISPTGNWWETGVTFNAAAAYLDPSPANQRMIQTLLPMYTVDDPRLSDGVVAIHYRARPEVDPDSAFVRSFIGLALFTPDLQPLYRYPIPVISPSSEPDGIDALGVEDPRVTRLGNEFYMVYCGLQSDPQKTWKARLCLAVSSDLLHWEKRGAMPGDIQQYDNKDGLLFPETIDGSYYLMHRPFAESFAREDVSIHLAVSETPFGPWEEIGEILRAYHNPRVLASWVGGGSVPVPVGEKRYIEIYHTGNFLNDVDREYDLDAALLDFKRNFMEEPANLVVSRLEPLMVPETPAELRSSSSLQVGNVLFTCGSYEFQGWIYIIYGGADTYTLAARARKDALLQALEQAGLENPFQ